VGYCGACTALVVGVGGLPYTDTPRPWEAVPKGRGGDNPDTGLAAEVGLVCVIPFVGA
jgi:hypothetical protein